MKKVASLHENPLFPLACGMSADNCRKLAREFTDSALGEVPRDSFVRKGTMDSWRYDLAVSTKQLGHILPDYGAGLAGCPELTSGSCIAHPQVMTQAMHGPTPDVADNGRSIADSFALIVSGQMLFEWLKRKHAEPKVVEAVRPTGAPVDLVIAEARH
jgi:3-isopropylmalate dehydrogenase